METLRRFGRPRGLSAAQVALAWLLARKDWIVPIPGTTKLAHLEENLRAAEVTIPGVDWDKLERKLAVIAVMGDRYPAHEQQQIQKS